MAQYEAQHTKEKRETAYQKIENLGHNIPPPPRDAGILFREVAKVDKKSKSPFKTHTLCGQFSQICSKESFLVKNNSHFLMPTKKIKKSLSPTFLVRLMQ
jgi:hypothetical protein